MKDKTAKKAKKEKDDADRDKSVSKAYKKFKKDTEKQKNATKNQVCTFGGTPSRVTSHNMSPLC